MKPIITWILSLWNIWLTSLKAKTPIVWVKIRDIFGYVPIIISVVNTATSGAAAPAWWTANQWYISSGAALILLIAQSQTKKTTNPPIS